MAKTRRVAWNDLLQDEKAETSKSDKEPVDDNPFAENSQRQERGQRSVFRERDPQFRRSSIEDILFIHPNDHAGLQLVAMQLTGNNFYVWSRAVKRALGARNKLDFIDGNFPEPAHDSPYHKLWLKDDYMVSTWIMNAMSKDIATAFQYIDDSRRLWEEVQNRYDRSSGPKLYQLERDLSRCVQNQLSVMYYFNKMSSIWDEINILSPSSSCTCGARDAMRQMTEKRKVNQFLLGLNDSYETACSQILLIEPLPSVSRVYSMILQDEDRYRGQLQMQMVGNRGQLQMQMLGYHSWRRNSRVNNHHRRPSSSSPSLQPLKTTHRHHLMPPPSIIFTAIYTR